jgi:hypothetical protein
MTYEPIAAENRDEKLVTINPHELIALMEPLTALQKGVFFKLLCHRWVDDMLPVTTAELARLAGTSPQHMGRSREKLDPLLSGDF